MLAPTLPASSWLTGHIRDLSRDKLELFRRCAERHAIVRLRLYWVGFHVVTDPGIAHEVLVKHADAFRKGRSLEFARRTFGNGLVTSEGAMWRRQRKLVGPALTPRATAGYRELMIASIGRKMDDWQRDEARDLYEDMIDVSLDVVCEALFGMKATDIKPLVRDVAHAVQAWHKHFEQWCLPHFNLLPIRTNFRHHRANRALDRVLYALLRRIEAGTGTGHEESHGILDTLLRSSGDKESGLTRHEIRHQVVTLLLAGHDTTATAMAFALYELAYRPDLQDAINAELCHANESETLRCVIKETLRLYPAVHMVSRMALKDVVIGTFPVKKGEEILISLWGMQRNPKVYASPDAFKPERFLQAASTPENAKGGQLEPYLPFSAGPRVCTGQAMAMQEIETVVGEVLRRFRLKPAGPRDIRLQAQLTLVPQPGATPVRVVRHCASSA